jgi:hypothetical protein
VKQSVSECFAIEDVGDSRPVGVGLLKGADFEFIVVNLYYWMSTILKTKSKRRLDEDLGSSECEL